LECQRIVSHPIDDPIMRAPSKPSALPLLNLSGLDQPSLFDGKPMPAGEPLMVEIDRLDEDPHNPRTEFPTEALDELARDIAQRGILQPLVVSAADDIGRYRIRFGSKRWRAARQAGLTEVPVTVATRAHDTYDQVAENLKRHSLTPLELARFIRERVDAGDSQATIARQLVIDPTTVAHHLALLTLPPMLDAALKTGRCASPRTLYELSQLHADQPERVATLVAGNKPITRGAVAELRDTALAISATRGASATTPPRPDRTAQRLARAHRLCEQLETALLRLSSTGGLDSLPADERVALRQRVVALATRLGE
jgi:ParB family transcriptional regulator, chromosome partitioning protein